MATRAIGKETRSPGNTKKRPGWKPGHPGQEKIGRDAIPGAGKASQPAGPLRGAPGRGRSRGAVRIRSRSSCGLSGAHSGRRGSLTTESKDNGAGWTGLGALLAGAPSFLKRARTNTDGQGLERRSGRGSPWLSLSSLESFGSLFLTPPSSPATTARSTPRGAERRSLRPPPWLPRGW